MKAKYISLLLVFLLAPWSSFAQETSTSKAALPEASQRRSPWNNLSLSLDVAPVVSGGAGLALEYDLNPRTSLWVSIDRSQKENKSAMYGVGAFAKSAATNRTLGIRYYTSDADFSGWFLSPGYRLTTLDSQAQGGDFFAAVVAHKTEELQGGVLGIGYRLQGKRNALFQWQFDVGANYGPGVIKKVTYVADSKGILGIDKAHLETDVGYGFVPEVRIGAQF